ncbi:TonB-dependent receptor [Caulobacter endophyticus]|uniref:TonB-dependent receptor n=1 Tax=Caulobacter endophyticus TaxID=2172652 RepID=UPI00240EAFDB|nr:TonB-dependent receptor [Caulobacter endophyticus]MDG2529118.1 TonB-dependent receptor [Caulobacter endophyticus]
MRHPNFTRRAQLAGVSAVVLAAFAVPAFAQEAPADTAQSDTAVEEVVVTGVRASLRSAQAMKRDASQIVDSIVATDIGKLPDRNVAEALQRIPGIQIDRNYGEGANIAIRGLTQVRTEINGRDSFTAGEGRGLSFEDVPSEVLAGVDVYKNPAADLIEGGIGGLVNLRTRMPFDFSGRKLSASITSNTYDFVEKTKPSASLLVSDRWDTRFGEIGVLANIAYQKGAFRQDTISTEPFYTLKPGDANYVNYPGYEGKTVTVPHGAGVNTTLGDRTRKGGVLGLQWRPNDRTEIYGQVVHSDYKFEWQDYSVFAYTGSNSILPVAGSTFKFDENGEFISGSFANVPYDSNTSFTQRHSVTTDYSIGGKWDATDDLTLSTDFQYVRAITDSVRSIVNVGATIPVFNHDISGDIPVITTGPSGYASNPSNFNLGYYLDHIDKSVGTEKAWRADAEYKPADAGILRSIKVGVRYTDREAVTRSSTYRFVGFFSPLSNYPNLYEVNQFDNFFRDKVDSFGPTVAFKRSIALDYRATLNALGLSEGVGYGPADTNTQGEKTYAMYGVARFGFDAGQFPVDGNVGLRVVRTNVTSAGFEGITPIVNYGQPGETSGTTIYSPVEVAQSYTKALPSLNLRIHLKEDLQLRLAASKGLSRPTFNQLNANANIGQPGSTQQGRNTVTFGNPNLRPLEADQFDASLEWYFNKTGMLYAAAFYKKVDGFIYNVTRSDVPISFPDGRTALFDITRPENGDDGKIKGFEVGYNQFFDFLPGLWSGLGVQANYTYVDSSAPNPTARDTSGVDLPNVPLEGLSKHSYNVVGIYEKGPISFRLAYNWRDDFVRTTSGNGTGNLPVYSKAFGQLDASATYDINDHMAFTIEGVNLTDTQRDTFFGKETRPRDSILVDRRVSATLRVDF